MQVSNNFNIHCVVFQSLTFTITYFTVLKTAMRNVIVYCVYTLFEQSASSVQT